MKEEYPSYEAYRELYKRYYQGRAVSELVRLLEPLPGRRVLDLCGGEGNLTVAMLAAGAREAVLVDSASQMVPAVIADDPRVRTHIMSARDFLLTLQSLETFFDRIVCRQGINYWLDAETAKLTADALAPGGLFVFNTFNQQPSTKPRVLQYDLDGHTFVEVSWLVGDVVHHVQMREDMTPHYTTFQWIPSDVLHSILEPHFIVDEERLEKTSLYRCEKR